MVALYVLAKLLESGDAWIWAWTGRSLSGHSLKHVAAAVALWAPLRMLATRVVH